MKRFRGGLVFKAHRLCVSLNSRLESNKEGALSREQDEKAEKDKEAKEQKALEKAEKDSKVSRPRLLHPQARPAAYCGPEVDSWQGGLTFTIYAPREASMRDRRIEKYILWLENISKSIMCGHSRQLLQISRENDRKTRGVK